MVTSEQNPTRKSRSRSSNTLTISSLLSHLEKIPSPAAIMELFSCDGPQQRPSDISVVVDDIKSKIASLLTSDSTSDQGTVLDEDAVFRYLDKIDYDSSLTKEFGVELIPVYLQLFDGSLAGTDGSGLHGIRSSNGKIRLKEYLELVYKCSKAKEVGFHLEQALHEESYGWETKGVVVEGLARAIRVMQQMKARSKFAARVLPTIQQQFRRCPAFQAVGILAEQALKFAQYFARTLDRLPDTEDLMPTTIAQESARDFAFLLLERVATDVTPYRKKLALASAAAGKTSGTSRAGAGRGGGGGQAYPRLRYLLKALANKLPVARYRLAQLLKAAGITFQSFLSRPAIEVSRTENNNLETSLLSLASFVYLAECHGVQIGKNNVLEETSVVVAASQASPPQPADGGDAASQAADGGDAATTSLSTSPKKASTPPSLDLAFLPRIFSVRMRFTYLRDACEVLLMNNKVAAGFHLFEQLVAPLQRQLLREQLALPATQRRRQFSEWLFPDSLYREMLRSLAVAETVEQREPGAEGAQLLELQQAVAAARTGEQNTASVAQAAPQEEYDVWATRFAEDDDDKQHKMVDSDDSEMPLSLASLAETPGLATSVTRTALWRAVEGALREVTTQHPALLADPDDLKIDDLKNEDAATLPPLDSLVQQHAALLVRFNQYYYPAMTAFSAQDSHLSCVIGSFKQDWWAVVQLLGAVAQVDSADHDGGEDLPGTTTRTQHVASVRTALGKMLDQVLTVTFTPEAEGQIIQEAEMNCPSASGVNGRSRKPFSHTAQARGLLRTYAEAQEANRDNELEQAQGKHTRKRRNRDVDAKRPPTAVAVADASDSICYGLNLAQLAVSHRAKQAFGPVFDPSSLNTKLDTLAEKIDVESRFAAGTPGADGANQEHEHVHGGGCCGSSSSHSAGQQQHQGVDLQASERAARKGRLERVSFLLESVRQACS